jgi:hypothetical protein
MSKRKINKCVAEILDSLCNRSGFDDWWYNLDDDTEKEIEKELRDIIERRLNPNKKEISFGEMINVWIKHHGSLDLDTNKQTIIDFYNQNKDK